MFTIDLISNKTIYNLMIASITFIPKNHERVRYFLQTFFFKNFENYKKISFTMKIYINHEEIFGFINYIEGSLIYEQYIESNQIFQLISLLFCMQKVNYLFHKSQFDKRKLRGHSSDCPYKVNYHDCENWMSIPVKVYGTCILSVIQYQHKETNIQCTIYLSRDDVNICKKGKNKI